MNTYAQAKNISFYKASRKKTGNPRPIGRKIIPENRQGSSRTVNAVMAIFGGQIMNPQTDPAIKEFQYLQEFDF